MRYHQQRPAADVKVIQSVARKGVEVNIPTACQFNTRGLNPRIGTGSWFGARSKPNT